VLNGHKEGRTQQQEPAFETIFYNKLLKISSICKISTITAIGPTNMYLCQALRLWSLAFASRSNKSKEFSFWVLLLLMSGGPPRTYKLGLHRGSFLVAIPSGRKRMKRRRKEVWWAYNTAYSQVTPSIHSDLMQLKGYLYHIRHHIQYHILMNDPCNMHM
jgi:hypothetical protein